ncbi:MAG: amino acid ABC transporter permease [Clostridiales bacterium]|nr:amino acid ABC transporter permease [Clostridiales bacterium]
MEIIMSFFDVARELLFAFGQNTIIFAATLVGAIPLGFIIMFGSTSRWKPIRAVVKTIVWVIRGTPLMLQLFIVQFGPGIMFNIPMRQRMVSTLIAFIINYAAYFSEIFRGGLESIPRGQYEAGQVLGMTGRQIFSKIVLFQVIKRITAPMGNEIITLIKDTSLARTIAVVEILRTAEIYSAKGYIGPLFYTAVYFLVFVGVLTVIFNKLEKKMDYYSG